MNNQNRNVYGSFIIGDMEVAISASSLQEVVNEPCEYNKIPLSPPYLIGLFKLRDAVIPVIDLRSIFTIKDINKVDVKKIAIIEYNDYWVGVLFDDTGEVFNDHNERRIDFSQEESTDKNSVINGVFKLGENKRLVHILDPYKLLHLEHIPKTKNQTHLNKNFGKRKQCISFYIGESLCAVEIHAIQEIVKINKIDNTALSSPLCLGIINIRGKTIPIININFILGCDNKLHINGDDDNSNSRIIIMRFNEYIFGLQVNSVESIISFFDNDIIKFPAISTKKENLFLGCITKNNTIETILLDYKKILSDSEIKNITQGHKELYEDASNIEIKKNSSKKRTYITFSIGNLYALDISEVKEIIDHPIELLTPPNLVKCFSGMFNLRDEIVTVINTRYIYNEIDNSGCNDKKIIIFSHDDIKYGLTVDSINSIVSFDEQDAISLPDSIFTNQSSDNLLKNFGEAIQITNADTPNTTLLVLKSDALINKIKMDAAA